MAKKTEPGRKIVAENRKARYSFAIGESFEAGIMLVGTEVKSLRQAKATIGESYVSPEGGEIWLINSNIPEYLKANRFNHEPTAAASCFSQAPDGEACRGGAARGHDHRAAQALFQRERQGQDRNRARQGQAEPRQARERKGPRLGAGEG
jgi:hypothetical protein